MKKSLLIFAAIAAALSFNACQEKGGGEGPTPNLPELKANFTSDNFTCDPGETLSLPFTVTNIEDAVLAFKAQSSSDACKVSVNTNDDYSGSVQFIAPAFSDGKPVTVTLSVNDPANKRTAEARTTVTVTESDPLQVALSSDIRSMATKPSGSFTLPITISGATSTVSVDNITATSGWSAKCDIASDNASGTIEVTAPAALSQSVTVNLTVKDENGRTASMEATVEIYEITTTPSAANCYIVAPGSTLTITAVKGNSAETLDFDNASLLWQDAESMVKAVSGNGEEGVVVVTLNAGTSGNAVVAAKKGDTIVWSWHVWVTDYDPEEDPFVYTAESGTSYTFMDRNLGATNNTKFDAGAFGLLYQWGRKDPFESGNDTQSSVAKSWYNIDNERVYPETRERKAFNDHKTTYLDSAIVNPMVFYSAPGSDYPYADWLTNEGELQDHDLWGGVSNHKTKYDPCPEGWMVPANDESWNFTKEYKKQGNLNDSRPYDSSYPWFIEWEEGLDCGFRYKQKDTGKEYWFPFAGKIDNNTGALNGVGGGANYNTRTPSNTCAALRIFAWGNPSSDSPLNRPYGSSVRCIKEN